MAPPASWPNCIAQGIESVPGCDARLRTVPAVSTVTEASAPAIPDAGAPYVELADLERMRRPGAGLAYPLRQHGGGDEVFLGRHRSAMAVPARSRGKPACVFTSTGSLHGGQESTLLSMMLPLLHHGMLLLGLPYTHPELMTTASGGTPYGASHWSGIERQPGRIGRHPPSGYRPRPTAGRKPPPNCKAPNGKSCSTKISTSVRSPA